MGSSRSSRARLTRLSLLALLALVVSGCGVPVQVQEPVALAAEVATALPKATQIPAEAPITAIPTALPEPRPAPRRPIYILDPNDQSALSRIIVVDPDAGRVVFEIRTRFLPEAVLSSDGARLYVADSFHTRVVRGEQYHVVSVYDARTGMVLVDDTEVSGRLLYKGLPMGEPFIHLSDDGARLYVKRYGDPDLHQLRLAILDAATLKTLYEGHLPKCDRLVRATAADWLCVNASVERVDPTGQSPVETLVHLGDSNIASATLVGDGTRLYLVSPDATVTIADLLRGTAAQVEKLELAAGWQVTGDAASSPDGKRLYVGVDLGDDENSYITDGIAVFDTESWKRLAIIKTRDWLGFFALSAAGDQLYVVNTIARSLSIYDTATFDVVHTLSNFGDQPTRVLVPDPAMNGPG